jgi:hypothetical protein
MLKKDSCWGMKIFVNHDESLITLITLDHAIWIFSPFFVLFFHLSHLVAGSKTKGDFSENFRPDDQLLAASSRFAPRFASFRVATNEVLAASCEVALRATMTCASPA